MIGKTGMGKTTLLEIFLSGLINNKCGCAFFDPHADSALSLLDQIPSHRVEDVVYLDFASEDAPSVNVVVSTGSQEMKSKRASALVSAFRHLWSDSWGPRLEYLLYHALRLLLDAENTSLVSLPRLFLDDGYRESLIRQSKDPFIRDFWTHEFGSWDPRYRREAMAPVLNKLGQFVSNPQLRSIFGQVRMKPDFRNLMDDGKILIINLSKGLIGDDAAKLSGALLISHLSALAMERASMEEVNRTPFTVVIDEAQNFLTGAVSSILSEARKYGLGLVLSVQHLGLVPDPILSSVLGNVGTMVCYRISASDAEVMSREYGNFFSPQQFVELPPYVTLVRPLASGSYPFRVSIDEPATLKFGYGPSIRSRSRDQFTTPREEVEEKLRKWRQS